MTTATKPHRRVDNLSRAGVGVSRFAGARGAAQEGGREVSDHNGLPSDLVSIPTDALRKIRAAIDQELGRRFRVGPIHSECREDNADALFRGQPVTLRYVSTDGLWAYISWREWACEAYPAGAPVSAWVCAADVRRLWQTETP